MCFWEILLSFASCFLLLTVFMQQFLASANI